METIESKGEENKAVLEQVVKQAKERGVEIDKYALGVRYEHESFEGSGLGHVIDESHLEYQNIYITKEAWDEAARLVLPLEEVLEVVVDHELIHEVHRDRVRRGLSRSFSTEALESITHGVQQREEYIKDKEKKFKKETMEWMQKKNGNVRDVFYTPFVNLSKSKIPVAEIYKGIVERIDKEVAEDEYLTALGIKVGDKK